MSEASAATRSRAVVPTSARGAPRVSAAAALGVAAVLPLFLGTGGAAMENLVLAAAYVIMALGLNIVVGLAGLLDLGYVAFFAIGAHVAAYFGSDFWANAGGGSGIHFDFLVILVLAIAATTAAGVLIGVPTLRLRGGYIGIVTLAFGEIIGQVASNGREIHLFGGSLTGGPQGISAIDRIDLPLLGRFGALDLRPWYWFALALVALTLIVNFRLRDSRVGRAWIALRDDEDAAAAAGIPIVRTKLVAYGVGAAMGGVSGAFLASYLGTVNPHQFTFSFSIFILAMVVLGGLGSIWGVVVGAITLTAINHWLLPTVLSGIPGKVGLDFDLSAISSGIYGFLLVTIMLLRPQGLLPQRRQGMRSTPSRASGRVDG
jgi:branched-chain amino acid transport system permease protein